LLLMKMWMVWMGVVNRWVVVEWQRLNRLEGDGAGEVGLLNVFWPLVSQVVGLVIVDGIHGAPLGRIVGTARGTERRVIVPACHR
jgi:hypothetical protein